jgi:hypothetical protein
MKWEIEFVIVPRNFGPTLSVRDNWSPARVHIEGSRGGVLKETSIEGDEKTVMEYIKRLFKEFKESDIVQLNVMQVLE